MDASYRVHSRIEDRGWLKEEKIARGHGEGGKGRKKERTTNEINKGPVLEDKGRAQGNGPEREGSVEERNLVVDGTGFCGRRGSGGAAGARAGAVRGRIRRCKCVT